MTASLLNSRNSERINTRKHRNRNRAKSRGTTTTTTTATSNSRKKTAKTLKEYMLM